MFFIKIFSSVKYGQWLWVMECVTLTFMIWYTPSLILDKRMKWDEKESEVLTIMKK